jgi:hypothetical protein
LKAVNLSLESPEPYLACPYCLTDIAAQEKPTLKTAKDVLGEEKASLQPAKTLCTHHFGYLSERSNKEKIPEECMACAEIVNCMLKAVKGCTGS